MRLLIVEDEVLVAWHMEDCLIAAGHSIVGVASSFSAAMEIAREDHPDLALVDMNLADQTSGIVAATQLRQEFAVPSVFVTGTPDHDLGPLTGSLGCLSKPFSDDDLRGAVTVAEAMIHGEASSDGPLNFKKYAKLTPFR